MADVTDQWANVGVCDLCEKTNNPLLYHCPIQHKFCEICFQDVQTKYRGNTDEYICKICDAPVRFGKTRLNSEFLRKLKVNPGIGRPYRYHSISPQRRSIQPAKNEEKTSSVTLESLFGLPESDLRKLFDKKKSGGDSEICTDAKILKSFYHSHRPIVCPHHYCRKTIAVSSFSNHFKYEHAEITRYSMEKNDELLLIVDVRTIEHQNSRCLGIVTIYENNKVDLIRSKSTHSVIKTCSKFCQKIPLDTFWIMLTGSDAKKPSSYLLLWLFSNTSEKYSCTLELSSKDDNFSVSSFCAVNAIPDDVCSDEIAESLNCLYLTHGQVLGLLDEGCELNLRVIIH